MKFDSKTFNPEAFGKYVDTVPKVTKNELLKSRALRPNEQIRNAFTGQTGVVYATLPMFGRIGGEALNYDGQTDITATSTTTFDRSVVVIGRAKGWTELDFSEDVTGGVDFMSNVGRQVSEYWEDIDQDTLLTILNGIFSMTGAGNSKFVENHTVKSDLAVGATTLNSAIQKASGDKKNKFSLIVMHSQVATNLENLNVLQYLKYTDANGIERQLQLAVWNGKTVLIDDAMPTEDIYTITKDVALDDNKTYFTRSGSAGNYVYAVVASPIVGNIATYYEFEGTDYTSYVLGEGAFDHEDVGVKVPFEMDRNPAVNGGQDTLYSRQRKVFAPYGISFTKKAMVTNSPTLAELGNGTNWELVHDGGSGSARNYFDHKDIPIVKLVSKG